MKNKTAAIRAIKQARYKDRVKELRRYFDGFAASDGYDLRDFDNWTGAEKAKITRYWEVMGIQIARPHVVKRYRKPSHIKSAIQFAQQDRPLKGQRAVLIPSDDPKSLQVSFNTKGDIKVKRRGVLVGKLLFDRRAFLTDPIKELRRVIGKTDATVFKLMNGPHESRGVFSRATIEDRVMQILRDYGDHDEDDRRSHHWQNWLTGIIPYSVKNADELVKQSNKYSALVRQSARARARKKSSDNYQITRRARLTGRR